MIQHIIHPNGREEWYKDDEHYRIYATATPQAL